MNESPLRAERDARVVRVEGESAEIVHDPDGEVWYVRASSVPGLTASADTLDDLLDALPLLMREARLP